MINLIIDSSVVIKWFYLEVDHQKAFDIYRNVVNGIYHLILPKLILYEVGNVILNKKPYDLGKIGEAKSIINGLDIEFLDIDTDDWQEIITDIADKFHLSFYDSCYIYFAKKHNTQLITADRKLFEKTRSLKLVKLL